MALSLFGALAKGVDLVGAIADLGEHGVGLALKYVSMKETTEACLKRVGGVFALVGAITDTIAFAGQYSDSVDHYDYGQAVGRGIQFTGGVFECVGAAMVLFGPEEGFLTEIGGPVAGAVGAALIGIGAITANYLMHNVNETFACLSFLGNHFREKETEVPWSGHKLPTLNPATEAQVLVELLSQFRLIGKLNMGSNEKSLMLDAPGAGWRIGFGSTEKYMLEHKAEWYQAPNRLTIYPGYLPAGAKFRIWVHSQWHQDAAHRADDEVYEVSVEPTETPGAPKEFQQTRGRFLKPAKVYRDKSGRVEYIDVCLDELEDRRDRTQLNFMTITVRVALVGAKNEFIVPYDRGKAVELVLPESCEGSSFNSEKWVAI